MLTSIDKFIESGCEQEKKYKVCRSRGGESCAFDGAMIVLQPIADAAHIVHGPIACCGNSWEGRGTSSSKGDLYRMGFTTDMSEIDIVYGSEEKLYNAILHTYALIKPKAIFVYATCVSGLIGEDIEAVCKRAETSIGIRVIPVNAPGFIGPKNLGNRIAGDVLLDHVIGTGEPPEWDSLHSTAPISLDHKCGTIPYDEEGLINLIGEYNIAGDLWLVEPILKEARIRVLSRITGDSTFEEITYAHRAKLNVVVCSRALINIAKEMEKRFGIPYIEVSFFGKTEMSRALRLIASQLDFLIQDSGFKNRVEGIIDREEYQISQGLKKYEHLKGKKALLYTGGVKSWSFISALMDLGIEIVAVGTKKSTFEDEEKMKEILGPEAPLIEDVTPKNLSRLFKEKKADILVAGGRNQYLAIKEGYPFVDVNQERHIPYAGYEGLMNFAEQISNSINFYKRNTYSCRNCENPCRCDSENSKDILLCDQKNRKISASNYKKETDVLINTLRHSQSIGAAIAFQGIEGALPIIHGAQGCTFLAKVLLTKHFKEPIALASTKLFTEDVVMGSEDNIKNVVKGFIEKNRPSLIGILTSGLSEVKGDDVQSMVESLMSEVKSQNKDCTILHISTPDYESGLEEGYAKAIEAVIKSIDHNSQSAVKKKTAEYLLPTNDRFINVLVGSHLTPADFTELREIIESFGLKPIMVPDLSALDGSRQGFSALAHGGVKMDEIKNIGSSIFTIAIGASMRAAAMILKERFGIEHMLFESISGLKDTDMFMEAMSMLSGKNIPAKYERQRRILIDGMRDAHFFYGGKKICLALEHDLSFQVSRWLYEMGAEIDIVDANSRDLFSIKGDFDLLISNSHAEDTANTLGVPLYQMGFPVYKVLGYCSKITIGYRGSLTLINEIANKLLGVHK